MTDCRNCPFWHSPKFKNNGMSWQAAQQGCSPVISSQCLVLGVSGSEPSCSFIKSTSAVVPPNRISWASVEYSVHFGRCCSVSAGAAKYLWYPWEVLLILQQLGQSTAVTLGFGSSTADLVVQGVDMLAAWAGPLPELPIPLLMTLFWVTCHLKYKRRYRYNIELNYFWNINKYIIMYLSCTQFKSFSLHCPRLTDFKISSKVIWESFWPDFFFVQLTFLHSELIHWMSIIWKVTNSSSIHLPQCKVQQFTVAISFVFWLVEELYLRYLITTLKILYYQCNLLCVTSVSFLISTYHPFRLFNFISDDYFYCDCWTVQCWNKMETLPECIHEDNNGRRRVTCMLGFEWQLHARENAPRLLILCLGMTWVTDVCLPRKFLSSRCFCFLKFLSPILLWFFPTRFLTAKILKTCIKWLAGVPLSSLRNVRLTVHRNFWKLFHQLKRSLS